MESPLNIPTFLFLDRCFHVGLQKVLVICGAATALPQYQIHLGKYYLDKTGF